MSEKRFNCVLGNGYHIINDNVDNMTYFLQEKNDVVKLVVVLNEQQATIEAKDKEIAELDQQCADFLGDKIKALEEFEECTDKLKAKIGEQQATIEQLQKSEDVKEFSALFNQSIALKREIKDLKEENDKLTKMLNANYKTNNELVQYIQMLESDNDE